MASSSLDQYEVTAQGSPQLEETSYLEEPSTLAVFLVCGLVLANMTLAVRWIFVQLAHGRLKGFLVSRKESKTSSSHQKEEPSNGVHSPKDIDESTLAHKVIAEVWEGTGALLLQVWSLHIMFNRNGGCTMLNTSSCFQDWPSSHRAPSGTVSAIQGLNNFLHHSSTLVLVALAVYVNLMPLAVYVNLMRSALLPLVVFNFTNPLLNASRAFNMLQMQTCKKIAFLAFTIVFFVARIVLVPPVVLRVAVIGMRQIPLHRGIGYTINFLLDAELPKEVSA
eukprot:gene5149-34960_t